jgi:hypothetical protein
LTPSTNGTPSCEVGAATWTSMPPTASTTVWNPAKSMTAKWSTRIPVRFSTVWISSGGPPNA